ncbi:MAG: hypothetical protein JW913_18215 [Chitinispirillaceae bacterium]|nr:hypothetical protein [Chitinispirillaceae bacterium]
MAGCLDTITGRVGLLTCLFVFIGNSGEPAAFDLTLPEYTARLLWSTPFGRCPGPTVSDDSLPLTTIIGTGGYDPVFREKVVDSSLARLKDSRTHAFDGTVLIRTAQKGWGLQGGWDCSRLTSAWTGEDYDFSENSVRSFNRLLFGGWRYWRHTALNCMIGVDPGYCSSANLDNNLYREKVASAWKSPGVDLSAGLTLTYPDIVIEYYYRNSTPFAGYHTIANKSNSGRRRLPLVMDENRFGIAALFSWDAIILQFDGAFNLLGGDADPGKSNDLPLSINGYGGSVNAAIGARRLPLRPQLRLSGEYRQFNAEGFDVSGTRFLRVDGGSFSFIEGAVELHPGKRGSFGPLGSFVRIKADNGKVDLYTFSGLLHVLGLPEGYKLYDATFMVTEGGLSGKREWRLWRNHTVKTGLALSGCRLYGSIETAERTQIWGFMPMPIYENHETSVFVDSKYAVIKAALHYSYTLRTHEMFISFQQILPIAISNGSDGSGKSEEAGVDTRRLYGGMRIDGGVIVRL